MIKRVEYPQAVYTPQRVREYVGNPFIEALPEIMSTDVLAQRLTRRPPFDPSERDEPSHLRFHMLERLRQLLIVFPAYFDIESSIGALIRQGYIHRNPFRPRGCPPCLPGTHRRNVSSRLGGRSRASSELVFVGLSGLGRLRSLNPYSIAIHRRFYGTVRTMAATACDTNRMGQDQLSTRWVIECGVSKLFRGDRRHYRYDSVRTGSTRTRGSTSRTSRMGCSRWRRVMRSARLSSMRCRTYLFRNPVDARDDEFLYEPASVYWRAVIYVGTYKSIALFQSEMRYCRRASGRGLKELRRPPSWKSPVWSLLLEAVFAYQWVKRPIALSDGLKKLLWDLSQGITDVLVALVINAQDYAIRHKSETLDTKIFNHVYKTDLRLLHPALNALRSRNPKKLTRFDDLYAQAK